MRSVWKWLPLLAGLLAGPAFAGEYRQPLIIGGKDVVASYPFMTALVLATDASNYNGQFCGGTLVASRWVLTAAHCAREVARASDLAVVVGQSVLGGNSAGRIAVDAIVVHQSFNDVELTNDVAVLHLAHAATATPVPLATAAQVLALPHGEDVLAIGWGDTDPAATYSFPQTLQEVTLDFIPQADCDFARYYGFDITADQVCAADLANDALPTVAGGLGVCGGDSGGPLLHGSTQIGIVSYGSDSDACAVAGKPDGFANVGYLRDWIDGATGSADVGVEARRFVVPGSETLSDIRVTVTNHSPVNTATTVAVRLHMLSGGLAWLDLGTTAGCDALTGNCLLGDLVPGAAVVLTFRVEAAAGASWQAAATSAYPGDYNPGNNEATVAVNIVVPPASGSGGGGAVGGLLALLAVLGLRRC